MGKYWVLFFLLSISFLGSGNSDCIYTIERNKIKLIYKASCASNEYPVLSTFIDSVNSSISNNDNFPSLLVEYNSIPIHTDREVVAIAFDTLLPFNLGYIMDKDLQRQINYLRTHTGPFPKDAYPFSINAQPDSLSNFPRGIKIVIHSDQEKVALLKRTLLWVNTHIGKIKKEQLSYIFMLNNGISIRLHSIDTSEVKDILNTNKMTSSFTNHISFKMIFFLFGLLLVLLFLHLKLKKLYS